MDAVQKTNGRGRRSMVAVLESKGFLSSRLFLAVAIIVCLVVLGCVVSPNTAWAADANTGKALFTGEVMFQNRGAACIACHNVESLGSLGGGALGFDLSKYAGGSASALSAILKSPQFPVMKDLFADRPLTEDEISSLVAYFESMPQPANPIQGPAPAGSFPFIGIAGLIVFLIIASIAWAGRLRGVRIPLVGGATR